MDSEGFRPVFMMGPQDSKGGLSLSLYFEQSDFTRLLSLVQKFGMLRVYKHGQDFFIALGTQQFLATNRLKEASLSTVEAKQFEPKDAEGLLSLADLLFHDRKHPFKIKAENFDDEFLVWTIARELKLAIEATDPEQSARFHEWVFEEEQRKRLLFSQMREEVLGQKPAADKGFKRVLNLHEVTLLVETIEVMRLLEVIASLEMVNIYYQGDNFILELPDFEVSVSQDFHKCMLHFGGISSLTAGAGELIAKIIDLLFYDRKQQYMRFEILRNPDAEKILFQALTGVNIPVRPMSVEQAQRFQVLQQASANAASLFTQNLEQKKSESNNPRPSNR